MTIEKTLQLIAESQLRAERRADKFDERFEKNEERAKKSDAKWEERFQKSDAKWEARSQESDAKWEARSQESDAKFEERSQAADKRMDRLDHKLRVMSNVVKAGIRMVEDMRKDFDYKFSALLDSQMRTDEELRKHAIEMKKLNEAQVKNDEKFNRLLERLGRPDRNGHS